jgi:hypothetical protein
MHNRRKLAYVRTPMVRNNTQSKRDYIPNYRSDRMRKGRTNERSFGDENGFFRVGLTACGRIGVNHAKRKIHNLRGVHTKVRIEMVESFVRSFVRIQPSSPSLEGRWNPLIQKRKCAGKSRENVRDDRTDANFIFASVLEI